MSWAANTVTNVGMTLINVSRVNHTSTSRSHLFGTQKGYASIDLVLSDILKVLRFGFCGTFTDPVEAHHGEVIRFSRWIVCVMFQPSCLPINVIGTANTTSNPFPVCNLRIQHSHTA